MTQRHHLFSWHYCSAGSKSPTLARKLNGGGGTHFVGLVIKCLTSDLWGVCIGACRRIWVNSVFLYQHRLLVVNTAFLITQHGLRLPPWLTFSILDYTTLNPRPDLIGDVAVCDLWPPRKMVRASAAHVATDLMCCEMDQMGPLILFCGAISLLFSLYSTDFILLLFTEESGLLRHLCSRPAIQQNTHSSLRKKDTVCSNQPFAPLCVFHLSLPVKLYEARSQENVNNTFSSRNNKVSNTFLPSLCFQFQAKAMW